MKLEKIFLENFRQYYGPQRLEFAKDSHRNVTIIHGVNGAGKTSFFLALNWCLYGRSLEGIKVVDNVGELISKEAAHRAAPGAKVETTVQLTFSHEGERYIVKRSLRGVKQKDGSVSLEGQEEFTMMRTSRTGGTERINNPVGAMNSILPVNVREYFLFDGEKIDNFAKPEAAAQVKQAIYLVLKLEILERSRRHLENAAQEYRRELKSITNEELRSLLEQDEKLRGERDSSEKQKEELEKEIELARQRIIEIDQKLREMQNARNLQQQRDRIDQQLNKRSQEKDDNVNRLRDYATGAYIVNFEPAINRALQLLDEKRSRGEIPSAVRQQFIQDLIEEMRCICGRPFAHGSPEYQRLVFVMSHSISGQTEDDILNTASSIRTFREKSTQLQTDISSAMRQRVELLDIIKQLDEQLDDVGRQLRNSPLEEISALEKKRQDFQEDIDDYHMKIGSLSERINTLTREIGDLKRRVDQARKNEKREQLLSTKLDLAQRTADAIKEMHQTFADDMRQKIEAKTKEIFKQLVWKESHFQDIKLGHDFNLEVIDRYGRSARPELSAGERQILSLSFITAMSRISEEEAPLVMDTPFGRLSSHHRDSITRHIPELANQLVLFVTDEELRDESRDNLEPRVGAEYRLSFDKETSCTEVKEVRR